MNTSPEIMYLDHAAATPCDSRVLEAMLPYFSDKFYNPSSPYAKAVEVRREYNDAKHRIAKQIGVQRDELIMTAGATESVNLAFSSARLLHHAHTVTSTIEHASVLAAAKQGFHTLAPANQSGIVSADAVRASLGPDTVLVSIALANNELGTIQPIKKISEVIRAERERRRIAGDSTPLYFHADGSQAVGSLDVHPQKLGLDMLTLSAGKIYGPKQVGLLWAASHVSLTAAVVGGGQERGLRSGTENVAGVIGFATALELVSQHQKSESARLSALRDSMQRQLEANIPELHVLGAQKKRLPHFLTVAIPGVDAERVIFAAEMQGVCVATGSACAANSGTRSHVLEAIGLEPKLADGSLRISLGRLSTKENITQATHILEEIIHHEQTRK